MKSSQKAKNEADVQTSPRLKINPYFIWACGALFYMYQFVLRVSPAVIVKDLMVAFQVDASAIGSLSAMSMYSYSLCQVPSGVLADRFGVRRIIIGSLLLCILGSVLFSTASGIGMAQFGRLIIGVGSSAAFLSGGKIAAIYFSGKRRATLFGLTMAAGTVGALNGGAPLAYLVSKIGWRESILVLSFIGVLVVALTFFALRKDPASAPQPGIKQRTLLEGLSEVLTNRIVWINAIVATGLYLSVSVFADLWGPSYIIEKFHVSRQVAAESVSLIYVGLFIGSLAVPLISDILNRKKIITLICILGISILLCLLLYVPSIPLWVASVIFFHIGFLGGAEMLCFAGACEAVSPASAATVTGLVNGVVMLSVACTQQQVGKLLDYFWKGAFAENSIRLYSSEEFQYALTILPIATGLCCLMALGLKDYSAVPQSETE